MNPYDLIKVAPEIAKGAAAVSAAIPFTAIVKRMLGPAADEVAEQLRTEIKVYRYGRTLKLLEKAERMAQEAGFTPKAVPIKLLFPLLEGASLEEDEDLHTMWAALLANASSAENEENVRPGFIGILREIAPDEAVLLNWIFDHALKMENALIVSFRYVDPSEAPIGNLAVCLDGLEASQLIRRSDSHEPGQTVDGGGSYSSNKSTHLASSPPSGAAIFADRKDKTYILTDRGRAFVQACRPPEPNK